MNRVMLNIGDVVIAREPTILQTTLGSCVSVCLWNERLGAGGMNHFMFPQLTGNATDHTFYGSESMGRLIGLFLELGIPCQSLKAKVFGGGVMIRGLYHRSDVGKENIRVAREILERHRIPIVAELTGKDFGMKVVFCSATGRALVKKIESLNRSF